MKNYQSEPSTKWNSNCSSMIIFGISEIQSCLIHGSISDQQSALSVALHRGSLGLRIIIQALHHPQPSVKSTALSLLRSRCETEVQQAIWNYLDLPAPKSTNDYSALQTSLAKEDWRIADEITTDLVLSMVNRQKQWLRSIDINKPSLTDIYLVDRLWRFYSSDRFGYSIQAKIWQQCYQQECTPLAYDAFAMSYCFSRSVDWHLRSYEASYLSKYDFQRKTKTPYSVAAPLGNLPSTFTLGGGDRKTEFERGDIESTMGFYASDRYYHSWSDDSLFGHDLLRQLYQLPCLQDRTN